MNHQIITCTGFGGTGSSVVSDLLKEFDNVKSCGADFEMTLAFDIDGISDLQHYIVDDFERNKTGEAIYRFERHINIIKKQYVNNLGRDFPKIIKEYLSELKMMEWNGYTLSHQYRYSKLGKWLLYTIPEKMQLIIRKCFSRDNGYEYTIYWKRKLPIALAAGEDLFFLATRKMYNRLLESYDRENAYDYLCFDQLVPAYNFQRYSKYFDNIKIILIDRDPRDLFLLNELYWKEEWIPSSNIDDYIKWFKLLRMQLNRDLESCPNVLSLKFEDCIYHYDDTLSTIMSFIGLDGINHTKKNLYFNPAISIKNTRLWEKTNMYEKEIEIIKRGLSEYIYTY